MFTFLFVGRIVGDKGINELVEAFIRLHSEYNKVRLLLVGFFEENIDPILPVTKTQIENTPSIIAAGEQLGDDLIAHYAAADCFVFPSYREGFPNTVMEAGAMGLPCIVTDINGSREIITSNIDDDNSTVAIKANGIIVPSKNVEMLYEAMKFIITNKEKREAMAANARPMIEKRFEQGFVRKCLYDYYEEIL